MGANDFYEDISFKLIFYPQLLEWRAFAENIPTHLMKACCILEVSKRHNWHVKRVEGGGGGKVLILRILHPFASVNV